MIEAQAQDAVISASPFSLENEAAYQAWREAKLAAIARTPEELIVSVVDPRAPSMDEIAALRQLVTRTNMAIYSSTLGTLEDKSIPRNLGRALGLQHLDPNMLADEDGITSLALVAGKSGRGYIPYSDKRLLWHTDGYYNDSRHTIRAMVLHCVRPAAAGGENSLLDHEIVYLLMRDENPNFIRALMAHDAMTIPANTESGAETRAAESGPVFSLDSATGDLHMRYTARTRSIEWKDDPVTRAARDFLVALVEGEGSYDYRLNLRLEAGQGLVCNNVLHNRTAFEDDAAMSRLIYRARYYERIDHTSWNHLSA